MEVEGTEVLVDAVDAVDVVDVVVASNKYNAAIEKNSLFLIK